MTDLMMLEHLLNKTGRMYDKHKGYTRIIIQVHVANIRHEWVFNLDGSLEEDWDNPYESQWIGSPYFEKV